MMHFMLYVFAFIAIQVTNGRYLLVEVTNDTGPGEITDVSKISGLFRGKRNDCWDCINKQCGVDLTQWEQFVKDCTTYKDENKFKRRQKFEQIGKALVVKKLREKEAEIKKLKKENAEHIETQNMTAEYVEKLELQ